MRRGFYLCVVVLGLTAAGCDSWSGTVQKMAAQPTPVSPPSDWELATTAISNGDTRAATFHAGRMLANNKNRKSWAYGNIVHEGNQILGLAALKEGRVADAKHYLILAGKTPGSPQLDSFGPNMMLAQRLLDKGQKDVVIQYLDLVAKFWAHTSPADLARMEKKKPGFAATVRKMDRDKQRQINTWKRQIRAGQKPKLNNSDGLF